MGQLFAMPCHRLMASTDGPIPVAIDGDEGLIAEHGFNEVVYTD